MIATLVSIIVQSAFSAVWSLLGALFLQLSTKIVAKFKQPFGKAYLSTLLSALAGIVLVSVFTLIAVSGAGPSVAAEVSYLSFSTALGFLAQLFVLAYTIKTPEGEYLNFVKTLLITILYNILVLLVVGVIVLVLVLVIGTSVFALMGMGGMSGAGA